MQDQMQDQMQDSPGVSAGGPPLGDHHASFLTSSPRRRESIREGIRRGDFDGLRGSMASSIANISSRFCTVGNTKEELEPLLHDLWYACYQTAMHTSHSSAELDRLAFDLCLARGRGCLKSPAQSDGSFRSFPWEDLPFFVTDMTDFWINHCATMGATQRLNLSYFLAKLASTSLDYDGLCRVALVLFRDTFETVRPLGSLAELGNATASPDATIQDLSIAALLPAAYAWIRHAGLKIFQLSVISWNDCSVTIGKGGATFTESELGRKSTSPAGFSPWRWLHWMKRLQEIADEATQAGETSLADDALNAICYMLGHVEDSGTLVETELDARPGFIRHQGRYKDYTAYTEWMQSSDCRET
ncbi:Uncharacterized protein TCAP_04491 [Tolypocladium capitatum]|uniref:Uncharacterized protein n=1 Tax=Tolypocladium capitatum TaxID=45235 RepID=A0A2K3QDG7_9HYPO|nr:Uncharacterized protein TCAP_04491 [Tolypocladium capitatum]